MSEKFITSNNNGYRLDRKTKDLRVSGSFSSLEDAVAVRDIYIDNNWRLDLSSPRLFFKNNYFYVLYKPDRQLKILIRTDDEKVAEQFIEGYRDMSYLAQEKNASTWRIQKSINDKVEWFGSYKTLDEAIKYRDLLREHKWDREYFNKIYKESEKKLDEYIYKVKGKYRVIRTFDDVQLTYGTYDTLSEARQRRDQLKEEGWKHKSEHFITKLFNLWWLKKESRTNRIPYINFYRYSENKERIEQAREYCLKHGFQRPLFKTTALRYLRYAGGRYYVEKNMNEGKHSFPAGTDLFQATVFRDILEEHNWNPPLQEYEKHGNRYVLDIVDDKYKLTLTEQLNPMKYIYRTKNGRYKITAYGKTWGTYNTIKEAKYMKQLLQCFKWNRQFYNAVYIRERNKHISYNNNNWKLYNLSKNIQLYYHDLDDARFVRDYLVDHDWQIPYDECITKTKHGYYIYLDMPPYYSYERTFKSYDVACEQLMQHVYHGIDGYERKFIRKNNGVYYIVTTVAPHKEKRWSKGTHDLEKAILMRDILVDNDWKIPEGEYYFDGELYNVDELCFMKKKSNLPRNIRKRKDKYLLYKIKGGKEFYYGIYSSLDEAIAMKEDLINHDWDKSYFHEKYGNSNNMGRPKKNKLPMYIRQIGERYELVKNIDGKLSYFGRYDNLDDAISMKRLMVDNDWNKDVYRKVYKDKRKNNGKKRRV